MIDPDKPLTQQIIEQEALEASADASHVSHIEAIAARVSAEVTAQAVKLRKLQAGCMVTVLSLPAGFLDGLEAVDQAAIQAVVGHPVRFNEYDERGCAELQFTDVNGVIHFIWLPPIHLSA
jgi:hypothetical protein